MPVALMNNNLDFEMDEKSLTPLILCMENANGEDVALKIEPTDNFKTFLDIAKTLLGFEVDINSITRNETVSLTDNIYEFLMNAEKNDPLNISTELNLDILEENASSDFVYMLDDGTQINASQIQFDNDEPEEKFNVNELPFIKRIDTTEAVDDNKINDATEIRTHNIESPLRKCKHVNPKKSFASTLPFRVLPNKAKNFEAQVNTFLAKRPTYFFNNIPATKLSSPIANINRDNNQIKSVQDITYTREQVLDLVKDSPLAANIENMNNSNNEIRRHARKTDPCKPVPKKIESTQPAINETPKKTQNNTQMCFVCEKYLDRVKDKLYIFDKEDQKLHRSLRQTKQSEDLKVLCDKCLKEHFRPGVVKDPELTLEDNEFLVIRNNQQFVFHRNIMDNNKSPKLEKIESENTKVLDDDEEVKFVKMIAETDNEIINNDNINVNNNVVVIKEEYQSEPEETNINNLDAVNENLEDFLGKYQEIDLAEAKCRFCYINFPDINCIIEHGLEHKHDIVEDGQIFPCPLCDYGYATHKWLKFHIRIAHDENFNKDNCNNVKQLFEKEKNNENSDGYLKSTENGGSQSKAVETDENSVDNVNKDSLEALISSPIAKRTRSSITKKKESCDKESSDKPEDIKPVEENHEMNIKTTLEVDPSKDIFSANDIKLDVKSEPQDKSDNESIWILEAEELSDNELCNDNSLWSFENKIKYKKEKSSKEKTHMSCQLCNQILVSKDSLKTHKCAKKRGRKRKNVNNDDVYVATEDEKEKEIKKKTRDYKRESQVMTCHNCNESFTSKVRLKFHMQFYENKCSSRNEGSYKCSDCKLNKVFSTENALFDHVHFDHPKQKRWQCPVEECGKTFYLRATLTKHSRGHTDTRRYVCPSCGKRFFDKQTLDEHGVTHLKIKPYQCHICLKQLTRRSRLRMHLRAHEEELSPALVYVCRVCARAFKDHTDAEEHGICFSSCVDVMTMPATHLCPTTGLLSDQPQNIKQLEEIFAKHKIYEPRDEDKKKSMLSQLSDAAKVVINVVEIEKAFRCEYCEEVFFLEDNLNNHRDLHKNVKNPFTCHICKVSFATYSRCTTHKTTHGFYKRPLPFKNKTETNDVGSESASGILGYGGFPVVKHFLCEDCGRSYLHWTYLQVHRRMKHPRNNMIHQCSTCHLTFPNSWSVSYHKKKVHGVQIGKKSKGNKDYWIPCRDCEEVLPNKSALYKHRSREHCNMTDREDSLSYCNTCEDDYDQSSSHKCMNKNKNKYFCLVCGHSFRTVTQRNEHLRIHTGEKPFNCKECGMTFRRLSALRNHRISHQEPEVPTYVHLLLEVPGLNPTPTRIIKELLEYHIKLENIVDVSKISFQKDDKVTIPKTKEELIQLLEIEGDELMQWKKDLMTQIYLRKFGQNHDFDKDNPSTSTFNQPNISQASCSVSSYSSIAPTSYPSYSSIAPTSYPITLNIPGEEISDVNLQLLLREGVVVNGSQMVPLYPNYPFLPESTSDIINSGISIEILQDVDKSAIIDME